MESTRTVSLFRNGANQALRIPKDFELDGDQAQVTKDGNRLIVEPVSASGLLGLLETWQPLNVKFPNVDEGLGKPAPVDL